MKDILQKQMKSALDMADQIEADIRSANRQPTDAEMKAYNGYLSQAETLKTQIDAASKREALGSWGDESAGSVVKSSFDRIALPGEGDIPGVAADANGELYAAPGEFRSAGQKKLDALKSGKYKDSFADYIRTVGRGGSMKSDAMKILNEGQDSTGGFWLPPDFRAELVKKKAAATTVRQNASVYTTGTDGITWPAANYTSDDRYTTGARFQWRASTGATSDYTEATNPIAGQEKIPAHLATAAIILTREQVEDTSFDVLGYLSDILSETFRLGEEDAFTNGDGVGKPQGFLTAPSASIAYGSTAVVAGKTYQGGLHYTGDTDDFTWAGLIETEAALAPQYEQGAKWFANKRSYARLRALNAGTATLPQWGLGEAWPNYANGMQASLLGYGIAKNQFMPDYGASPTGAPLVLGDMKGYYIVDRIGISIEIFREVFGLRDQIVCYARARTGGQLVRPWMMQYLTMTA